jgi:NADH-quinone oxidoreductase subunit D/NADH-quinone oxidoreductase subunit C/D
MSAAADTVLAEIATTTLDRRLRAPPLRDGDGERDGSGAGSIGEDFIVNMGPQHPSTHGVLRLVLRLDGEVVREVTPVVGYVHRGIEKVAEHETARQLVHLSDRMDYLSALMNNLAVSLTVERAAKIETTDRISVVRTIMAELQRIQSHQLWWGVTGMDLGAFTPFLYGFRDRERITDIFEETIGARLTMNYIQPGGLMQDIHPNFVRRVKEFIAYFRPKLREYEELLGESVIIRERLRDVGVMDAKTAVGLGATGPVLRASGMPLDLRKTAPYVSYGAVSFSVAVGSRGDCWDRFWVRLEEMRQSLSIVEQLIDGIPEGKFSTVKPAIVIKIPEGVHCGQVETARGILGVLIVGDGGGTPYRCHFRTPNFNNLWCITAVARGCWLADLVAVISSLDLVIPDIDR